tara:strand:+ start:410 stop:1102 length:693 start_codon:yes stop_codon:yes gene_type:complete
MKLLIESWRNYLKEIGDASAEPFDWALGSNDEYEVEYNFVSSDDPNGEDGSDYQVFFKQSTTWEDGEYVKREVPIWTLDFEANASMKQTGEGHPLRIMSTVVAIVNDFISNPEVNRGILDFVFEGIDKGGEVGSKGQTSRTKMYLRFLKKNLPANFEFRIAGDNVIFFGAKDEEEELDENDYPITSQRANKEINQVITPTKKKNAQTKLPGWKQLKSNYKGSAPPGAGGS